MSRRNLGLLAVAAVLMASPAAVPGRLVEHWDYPHLF